MAKLPHKRIIVVLLGSILMISGQQALACRCGVDFRERNSRETARKRAEAYAAIFEGRVKKVTLNTPEVTAKIGETIPVSEEAHFGDFTKMVQVIFEVTRTYRGVNANEVAVYTAFGGGDCGASFLTGTTYLVFASGPDLNHLSVSLCSPGGIVGSESIAADLRYLRHEKPSPADLKDWKPFWQQSKLEQDSYHKNAAEFRNQVTGKICGKVGRGGGTLSFLPTIGYSLYAHPSAEVGENGSFCSESLGPGAYYLLYTHGTNAAQFYPGVSDINSAQQVDIRGGQVRTGINFDISSQRSYAIRGLISANDKAGLDSHSVVLLLLSADTPIGERMQLQNIDFTTSLPLPKTKYFSFENVLPGRYLLWVRVVGKEWYTQRAEVTVKNHSKFISLELIHKN